MSLKLIYQPLSFLFFVYDSNQVVNVLLPCLSLCNQFTVKNCFTKLIIVLTYRTATNQFIKSYHFN
jgi:hypothetical protein